MIETIKLSEHELDNCFEVMRKGNTKLKNLAAMIGMENRKFRAKLFKHETFNSENWPELTPEQVVEFASAVPDIMAVRNIEWKILRQYSRLARRHANSWAKKMKGTVVDSEDYLQEAMFALLDSIYGYTDESIHFMTFAWWSIHNRLTTAANKNSPFSPLTNEAMALLQRFDEAKIKMNRHVTDQEVYEAVGFNDEEIAVVKEAQVKVYNACAVKEHNEEQCSTANAGIDDYTSHRSGIDGERDTVPCNYEIREALEHANLTPLERRIVETSLYPHYGWKTEIAAETINPSTQKPYTKARIGQILDIALLKIKNAYLKRDVA